MLFNKKLDKKDKTKKGFTLVELLAVIVVITLISGVGIITYLKTINNSKSKATLLAINNIKEAAYLYSKEGTDEIEWVNSYGKDGKESGKYACVSVQQLINKGYFKDNFLDKEIYKNSEIDKNTFIKVSMGTNNDNLKVVVNKNDDTKDKCIGSAINGDLFHLRLDKHERYTDTIKLKVSSKDNDITPKNYIVSIDGKQEEKQSISGEVTFDNLTNSTLYKIKACMTTKDNNYYCDSFDIFTKDFIKPKFTIDSGWSKEKTININYDDTPIYGQKGSHYFTSEVNGTINNGMVYKCNADYSVCSSTATTTIEFGKNYKLNDNEVSFTTTDNIDKGVSKKLTAIIKDPTKNSDESFGTVNKIDRVPPTCQILNAPSGWVGKNFELKSSCSDSGSGCFKNSYVAKVSTSNKQTIKVRDKVGNTSTCSAYVMVDTTPPTCNVSVDGETEGTNGWYKEGTSSSNPVKVTIGCNDENGCEQDSVSGGSFYTDGEHKYSKEIKDKFGNTTTCSGTIKIDTKKPSCTNSGGSSDWTNTDVTIKGICNDNGGSGCVKKNNDSYDNDGTVSKTIRNEGEHTNLSPGRVYDKAGNSTLCNSDRIVKIDKTKPTCTVSSSNSNWTKKNVKVTGTCSDDKSDCVKKTISVTKKSTMNDDVSPGTVYDKAGNKTPCDTKRVKIDKTPPRIGKIYRATSKPTSGNGKTACKDASNSSYYYYFEISDNDSGLKKGKFKWSTTSSPNAGNPTSRSGKSHWECIGTSASSVGNLKLTYEICDVAGNCIKK